jgi:two-component system LytT family response regulator
MDDPFVLSIAPHPGRNGPDDADAAGSLAPLPASTTGHPWLTRIPVRSVHRIVIVPVESVTRLEAEDNYVRIWADRPYLHKETLTSLVSRLDPATFLRVHRSHAVNLTLVRELRPQLHGEYTIVLGDGATIVSGRSYRTRIQQVFGLGRGDPA